MLFSQNIPPSPSPTESKSLSVSCMDKEATNWEKLFASEAPDERHGFRICYEISKLNKRAQNLVLKISKLFENTL